MKAPAYVQFYLSILFLLFIFHIGIVNARHLISSHFVLEPDHKNFDLARIEAGQFLETNPGRFTANGTNQAIYLKKYDSWPLLYSNQDQPYTPIFFSNDLFIYNSEFIDVGDGRPGMMAACQTPYKRLFFIRIGNRIFIYLVDWFLDYSTRSNYFSCSRFGYSNFYERSQICFIPAPKIISVPRSCLVPINGPVKPGNVGYPIFIDDPKPKAPKTRVLVPREIPNPIDGDPTIIPIQARVKMKKANEVEKAVNTPRRNYKNAEILARDSEQKPDLFQEKKKPAKKRRKSKVQIDHSENYSGYGNNGGSKETFTPKYSSPKTKTKSSLPSKSSYTEPRQKVKRSYNPKPSSSFSRPSYSKPKPVTRPVSRPRPSPKPIARPARAKPASKAVIRQIPKAKPTSKQRSKGRRG